MYLGSAVSNQQFVTSSTYVYNNKDLCVLGNSSTNKNNSNCTRFKAIYYRARFTINSSDRYDGLMKALIGSSIKLFITVANATTTTTTAATTTATATTATATTATIEVYLQFWKIELLQTWSLQPLENRFYSFSIGTWLVQKIRKPLKSKRHQRRRQRRRQHRHR